MDPAAVSSLQASFDVLYEPDLAERSAELAKALADADAIIVRNRTQVNAALLAHAPALVAVGRLGVGLDNIDLDLCRYWFCSIEHLFYISNARP